MRDFIITKDWCPHCVQLKIGKILSLNDDIDLVNIHDGDPRIKALENKIGNVTREKIPIGEINDGGTLINFSRESQYMFHLFRKDGI